MGDLIGLTVSAAGGGVFGLLGTALGRVAGFLERRQTYQHEHARWAHEMRLLEIQRDMEREESEADLILAETQGGWGAMKASIDADAAIAPSYAWVNAVRALTRPVLTLAFWVIAGVIFIVSEAEARAALVETTTFAATAATLWWFGDRGARLSRSG